MAAAGKLSMVVVMMLIATISNFVSADPDMLQDVCVADFNNVYVLYGEINVGFITTANVLVSMNVKQGEIFTIPKGLVHFEINIGTGPAATIVGFNSQNPGRQDIAGLFNATPSVSDSVLSKAFQLSFEQVDEIKSKLGGKY